MTVIVFLLAFFCTANFSFVSAQTTSQMATSDTTVIRKPLYPLNIAPTTESNIPVPYEADDTMLVGTESGLFKVNSSDTYVPLWTGGKVKQIVHTNQRWYFLTSEGILTSVDLNTFALKNKGLTELTIEKYENKQITLVKEIQDLKDLCVNPLNPQQLVTATKDAVFITRDGGETWTSIGSMSKATAGIKAVAIATIKDQLVVCMSHAIFGFSYILPDEPKAEWHDVSAGFKILDSMSTPDEIADILPVFRTGADGTPYVEFYISQTFIPNIYRFNWERKRAECIYTGNEPSDTIDSLTHVEDALLFTQPGTVNAFDFKSNTVPGTPAQLNEWKNLFSYAPSAVNTAWIPQKRSGFSVGFSLCELWMLSPQTVVSPYKNQIVGKKSIYVPPYQVRKQAGIDGINKFRDIIKNNNLNSLVIDMKDDYGLLRYETHDPLVMEKGSVSAYATDLDLFISEFKKDNIYLIARIVVFKDRNLSRYGGGKYAVWDSRLNAPWVGTKGTEDVLDADGNPTGKKQTAYYDENWVDPYSPEVWEYDIAIAKELVARGFDEIQFDYIRFPTDGLNLGNATFRWKQKGMDKESALISFLSYARKNIAAPISIDIYGANGWYRSGTRTGQDVEMLAKYVDVIAPMFYPSHFENGFMNYAPYPDRPYRIYFYGTYRNTIIGRNHIVVRPWVQAFKLGVKYDRQYYGADYVQKEIFGVRDSVNRGYMYWNNVGNYDTLQPDVGDAPYTGKALEASTKFRKPTFSSGK